MSRSKLPPPPPIEAALFTLEEAAGYLRIRRRAIDELRRTDTSFPKPVLVSGGMPRIRRADLDAWIAGRPTGWSSMGGKRPGAFGRPEAA